MPKIQTENFRQKIPAENSGASQNLGVYTEFMHLVKIQAYDKTMADVEISAPSQNIGGKVWRPLTIWARQNLQLLTSSWCG